VVIEEVLIARTITHENKRINRKV